MFFISLRGEWAEARSPPTGSRSSLFLFTLASFSAGFRDEGDPIRRSCSQRNLVPQKESSLHDLAVAGYGSGSHTSSTMVSVMVSQRLDRELSWREYRVEFLPIRTDMSGGNPTLVCRRGNTHRPPACTFRIRRRTRRLDGDSMFPLPNHHYRPGGSAGPSSESLMRLVHWQKYQYRLAL
jgi:hypothetical protein